MFKIVRLSFITTVVQLLEDMDIVKVVISHGKSFSYSNRIKSSIGHDEVLKTIRNSHEHDRIVLTVMRICRDPETPIFDLNPGVLPLIQEHFSSLSPVSAYNLCVEIIELLKDGCISRWFISTNFCCVVVFKVHSGSTHSFTYFSYRLIRLKYSWPNY